jgi:hypothetical protein
MFPLLYTIKIVLLLSRSVRPGIARCKGNMMALAGLFRRYEEERHGIM